MTNIESLHEIYCTEQDINTNEYLLFILMAELQQYELHKYAPGCYSLTYIVGLDEYNCTGTNVLSLFAEAVMTQGPL
jgi:hypothetical protein